MSTLHQVAKATGLSVSSVSEILRDKPGYQEETRQRVIAAAQRLQYRPSMAARQLRSGRSGWLGVLLNLDQPGVQGARLAGLERAALARGYRLVVGRLAAGESLEDYLARGLDGVFWLHPPHLDRTRLSEEDRALAPVVAVDAPLGPAGGCVRMDYAAGVAAALAHLRNRGCRRLGLVGDDRAELRLLQQPFFHAGGKASDVWTLEAESGSAESVAPLLEAWIRKTRVDGLLAGHDRVAALLLKGLRALKKRVPQEVAVVGWGHEEGAAWLDPALTTVDLQADDWARAAMELMARLLDKRGLPVRERTVVIEPRLVVRESA